MSSANVTESFLPTSDTDFAADAIQTGSTYQCEFKVGSLEPTWIVEGSPIVRALGLTKSEDGLFSCGLWDCTAGKFKFIFSCDEIVHIIEGEVIVEEDGPDAGVGYTLRPGDVAYFSKGMTTYWTVPHYVKKFCVHRSVTRSLMDKITSRLKRLMKWQVGKSVQSVFCWAWLTLSSNPEMLTLSFEF